MAAAFVPRDGEGSVDLPLTSVALVAKPAPRRLHTPLLAAESMQKSAMNRQQCCSHEDRAVLSAVARLEPLPLCAG
jgi:hypothetical protein